MCNFENKVDSKSTPLKVYYKNSKLFSTHFHMNSSTPGLALIDIHCRLMVKQKWTIQSLKNKQGLRINVIHSELITSPGVFLPRPLCHPAPLQIPGMGCTSQDYPAALLYIHRYLLMGQALVQSLSLYVMSLHRSQGWSPRSGL